MGPNETRPPSALTQTLYQTAAMVFSNMFLVQIAPESFVTCSDSSDSAGQRKRVIH